jgi:CelD/BcsL family acetyltransferase involved in cellulose biosynthesis
MDSRLIDLQSLSSSEEQAWSALAERAVEPNPFFEPGFLLTACRHFEGFSKTRLLVVSEGPEFRAVLPIVAIGRPRVPPRRTIETRGSPTMVSVMSTPLVDRECVEQAVGALLDGLRSGSARGEIPGIVSLARATEKGPVLDALRRGAAARGMPTFIQETWERGMVSRGGTWEQPLTGDRRRSNARRRRRLSEEFGKEVSIVNRTLDPGAPADFLRMEVSGWKGRDEGTAYARDPAKVAWFQEWCDWWTSAGRLVVIAVNLGDISIAMLYCIIGGEGIFLYRTAYDDAYAKYGPGALLLEAVMEALLQEKGAQWIDSSTDPGNKINLEMLPERRSIAMLLVATGGRADRLAVSAMPALTRGVSELRRLRRRVSGAAAKVRTRADGDT